jgi:DNA-binding NarL/FixJ family response regulator
MKRYANRCLAEQMTSLPAKLRMEQMLSVRHGAQARLCTVGHNDASDDGFEVARRIKHEFPSTLILIVSQFDSAPFARAGASRYVVKSNASSELIPALRKVHYQHAAKADHEPAQY